MSNQTLTSLALITLLTAGCGAAPQTMLPDESGDLTAGTQAAMPRHLAGTEPAGPDLGGTQWRWLEAHCTEGPLDLSGAGYQASLRVRADAQGLLLIQDSRMTEPACAATTYHRYRPGATPDATWQMESVAHIAVPAGCGIQREQDRPGDVRRRGSLLEVFVQRSNWCRGLELKMVYAEEPTTLLGGEELARHYAAEFNRRNASSLAELFAVSGSLVEPFTESDTGVTRHEGRDAVLRWHLDALAGTPWLAMQYDSMEAGSEPGQFVATWGYMDPRLEDPMAGRTTFTVAAGEIFEAEVSLVAAPVESGDEEEGDAAAEGSGETAEE